MYLKAISIGYAVPRTGFDATVHSVFQSAINLRLSKGNELLTLVSSSGADLPQGIRLDTPDNFSFEGFNVGERVTCRDNNLRIDSLTIELGGARCWKCDLPALQADFTNPVAVTRWRSVWLVLNKRQVQMNAEILAEALFRQDVTPRSAVAGRAGYAMRSLLDATQRYDMSVASPVSALIGLGVGLTPIGDDLLIGYLAGLWCAVRDVSDRVQFVSNLGTTITQQSHQTNEISRTYLNYASLGQVSSLLVNLAEAICVGENSDRLLDTAEITMQVGHTSGMDTVTGLLMGLTVWEGNSLGFPLKKP